MVEPVNNPKPQIDDLAQIIGAYHAVTEKLQQSHEALRLQVDRLQEQLASKDAQLQRSKRLAALGEMAAGIAHEVRNPLAAIHLYADMIVQDLQSVGDEYPQHSTQPVSSALDSGRKIMAAVRGLDAIVRDVLSFARELSPRMSSVDVTELFDRVLATCHADITAGGVEVVRDDDGEPITLQADADLLHQALVNLVRNAVQAMADLKKFENDQTPSPQPSPGGRGGPTSQPFVLTLSAHTQNNRVCLQVRDTGTGIASDDIDRIFNPFFTTRATGTGLGLAIVHRIVDAHHGSITAVNHQQGGAVFEISLPVATSTPTATTSTITITTSGSRTVLAGALA